METALSNKCWLSKIVAYMLVLVVVTLRLGLLPFVIVSECL